MKEMVSLISNMPWSGKVDMCTEARRRDVIVTRVFDALVEQVRKAWSDPEYVIRGRLARMARVAQMVGGRILAQTKR